MRTPSSTARSIAIVGVTLIAISSSLKPFTDTRIISRGGRIVLSQAQHITPQQSDRYESDAWEDAISAYLADLSRTTIGQVAADALGITEKKYLGVAEQRRIMAAMTRLGWARGERSPTARWWVPASSL